MKITRVEPILIAVPYEHGGPKPMRPLGPWTHMETLFVRVDTDAGLIGWGEAFGFAASPLDPTRRSRASSRRSVSAASSPMCPSFMADLQRKLHAMGRHGPVSFALAGIDIALWDIAGQSARRADPSPARRRHPGSHSDLCESVALRQRRPRRPLYGRGDRARLHGDQAARASDRDDRSRPRRPPAPTSRSWSTPIVPGRRTRRSPWRGN